MAQAFLLRFDDETGSSGDYVNFTSGVVIPSSSTSFVIRIIGSPAADVDHWRPLGSNQSNAQNRVIVFANRTVTLSGFFSGQTNSWTSPIPISQIELMEFVKNPTGRLDLFINGTVVSGGFNNHSFGYNFLRIGWNFGNASRAFDLKGLQFEVDGVMIHNYDPSIVLADPNILVDTVSGNNGTMVNFPSDGSARVPYDDDGGSTEQITTSGGIVSTLAGCSASAQIINEQVLSASGLAATVAAGIASTAIVNEQVISSGGIASAVASASTSTSTINEQALNSSGIAAAFAGATASTQVINEQTSEQVVSSGGIAASIGSAAASTQVIHEQVVSSGGVAPALAGGVGATTVVDQYAVVQVVQSGGISSAYMIGIASTSQVVEQIVSSGGVAAAVMTGSASTIVRDLSGDWGAPEILFSEVQPIEQISLTFDQLGRPLVFYRVGEDTLKLYWYDPVAQQNVLTNFGIGKDPTACFDFPQDTSQSFTDVLLFYVRDDQVFMRIQRDRYAIEYPCPAANDSLTINSSGLRIDNRLQVVYKFKSVPDESFKNYVIESDFTINLLNDVSLNSVIGDSLNVISSSNLSILTQVNVDSIPNYSQEIIEDIVTNFTLSIKNDLNILSLIFVDSIEPTVVTNFSLGIKNSLNILSSIFEEPLTPRDVISEVSIESKVNFSFISEKAFEKNDTGYLFGTSNLGSFITYYDDNLNIYTPLAEPNINTFGTLTEVKLPSCVSADECWFAQVKPNELNKIEFYERSGFNFALNNTLTLSLIENGRIISIALSSNGNYLAVGFSYSFLLTDTENKSSDLYYLVKVFRKINGQFQEIPFNNQLTLKGGFVTEEYKDAEIEKGDFPIGELEEQWATFRYNAGVVQLSFNPVDNDLIIIYESIIKGDQPLYINWFNKNGDLFEESLWPIAQTPATPNKMYWQNNNDLVVSHAFSPFHTKYSKLLGSFRVSATTPFPPAKNVVGNAAFTLGWAEGAFKNDIAVLSGGTNPLNRVIYENSSIWSAGGSINPVIDIRNLVLSPKGNKLLCSALFYNESNNTTGLFKVFNKNNYDYVLSNVDLGEEKINGFGDTYTPNFCYWFTESNLLSLDDTKKVNDSFYLKTYSLVDFSNKKLNETNSYITEDVRGFNWVWVDINRIRSDDRGIFLGDIDNYKVTVEFIYTVNSLNRATIKAFEVIENGIGFSIDILSNGAISVTNLMDNLILTSEYRYTTLGETVHLALTSSNGITTLWLNGINQGSVNWVLPMFSQSIRLNQGWFRLNQLRITKDVRYTTNFDRVTNFNMVKEY